MFLTCDFQIQNNDYFEFGNHMLRNIHNDYFEFIFFFFQKSLAQEDMHCQYNNGFNCI